MKNNLSIFDVTARTADCHAILSSQLSPFTVIMRDMRYMYGGVGCCYKSDLCHELVCIARTDGDQLQVRTCSVSFFVLPVGRQDLAATSQDT